MCPLRLARRGWGFKDRGFLFEVSGGAVDLLDYLAGKGFAGLSVNVLKQLAAAMDLDTSEFKASEHFRESLILSLMCRVLGDNLPEEQAVKIMVEAETGEGEMVQDALGGLSDDIVFDVMLASEQTEAAKFLKQAREETKERVEKQSRIRTVTKARCAPTIANEAPFPRKVANIARVISIEAEAPYQNTSATNTCMFRTHTQ